MEIQPRSFAIEEVCGTLVCEDATCSAFLQPPTSFPPFDGPDVPPPPFALCPATSQPLANGFFVTFCPDGSFPSSPTVGVTLHPNGDTEKCLDVRGAVFEDGTPVQIFDCNDTPAQRWILNRDTTQVTLAGTNFCLDAGTTPGNNTPMKIWECFLGLTQQTWFYTDDNRIALQGQGQCLDLTNGILTNSNQVQIFQCTDLDTNQIWITG
ncbi:carbohydrate-binding module family 13 protein [Sphaerobolus stellatus SS14]|nr:carbohydrate-binding module family 13 protein [Sphaerobolus stellatus SS14]